jgi:bifunctional ADP-heptose synthase (sugar kinase/adenylyltransferase)
LKNVYPVFLKNPESRTLIKRRYIGDEMTKLFEVYISDVEHMPKSLDLEACHWLNDNLQHFDAVIVPDFGNGFISPNMVERLAEKSRFLAVNTQVNSGNRGYHLINRYPRADFISLNEPELRMAACNRTGELNQLANNIAANLQANHLAVTRGKQGVLMVSQDNGQKYSVPALSTNVVDRIGAGDAFLSLAGLCLAGRLDADREPVDPVSLLKYIDTLLK